MVGFRAVLLTPVDGNVKMSLPEFLPKSHHMESGNGEKWEGPA